MRCLFAATFILFCTRSLALAVAIPTVPVGNPGNAPDLDYGRGEFGAVDYTYRIAKYKVTNGQYVEFLNTKDPTGANTIGLYSASMADATLGGIIFAGENEVGHKYVPIAGKENRPVNSVSWYDAIRFANWLNNGQGAGGTETGAYTLGPLDLDGVPINGLSITRNPGAKVVLTSEDEWYKAAYYDPSTESYFLYPTASNTPPTAEAPPGGDNSANYGNAVGNLTDVGAYGSSASPYGTFDQGGNIVELTESLVSEIFRNHRGTAYNNSASLMLSSSAFGVIPPSGSNFVHGFRVAFVPEPSTLALAAFGFLALAAWGWRRRKR